MKRTKVETRARILEAAQELLEKRSSQFIQLRDIAQRAGVSASLLVQYFGSKEELVFEARIARIQLESEQHFAPLASKTDLSLDRVLRAFFKRDLDFSAAAKDLMSLSWWWTQDDEKRFLEALRHRYRAIKAALRNEFAVGVSDEARIRTAAELVAVLYVHVLREACMGDSTVEQAMKRLNGLLAPVLAPSRAPKPPKRRAPES
jgi:AcrR family transcriptional regulator